jgi:enoyl-CoA hydratase/carnithine racemase
MSDLVTYEVADGVATLTMRRAESRNALNAQVRDGLRAGFAAFAEDGSAKVLVLAGEGPVFCAGGDLKEMSSTHLQVPPENYIPTIREFPKCDKPVIAAVQGAAYGGGFCLALWCDLVVAGEDARFAVAEAKWGRGAPWATSLVEVIGPRAALQLLVTAEPISAQRAYEIGFVNEVAPAGAHLAAAHRMAQAIAALAPLSVRAGVRMIRAAVGNNTRELSEQARGIWEPAYTSADAQEGPLAFAEKRAPRWQGR